MEVRSWLLIVLVCGCGNKAVDSADTGGDGDGVAAGQGVDWVVDHAWSTSGIVVAITGGSGGGYQFGMAETGAADGGWYQEDCVSVDAGAICHELGATGGALITVPTPDLVVAGSTTMLTQTEADGITYYLEDAAGNCHAWGHDASYFACSSAGR